MRQAAGARIGDYQLTSELPPTAAGILEFTATHVLLPRQARLRVGSEHVAKRLMREACILEALRHPGVPRVFECGLLADRRPWIALEMIDGPTLADAIGDRPLLANETLALLRDLAQILHHAHARGIVHCRLRPELVVRDSTGLYITSWGGASTHDGAPQLDAADNQHYLAPELARGAPFDERADIFSLGVIASEALALSALPRAFVLFVERMISGTPLARPTAAEVRAEAIGLLASLETPPPDDIDAAIVEEIELELTQDLSRERPLRWTPPYQPTHLAGDVLDPLSDRRR